MAGKTYPRRVCCVLKSRRPSCSPRSSAGPLPGTYYAADSAAPPPGTCRPRRKRRTLPHKKRGAMPLKPPPPGTYYAAHAHAPHSRLSQHRRHRSPAAAPLMPQAPQLLTSPTPLFDYAAPTHCHKPYLPPPPLPFGKIMVYKGGVVISHGCRCVKKGC